MKGVCHTKEWSFEGGVSMEKVTLESDRCVSH